VDGAEYIDAFSANQAVQCGYGREEIARAVYEQLKTLSFYPSVIDYFTPPTIKLAEKLARLLPGDLSICYFVNDGSEAVETALKIAKRTQQARGYLGRYKVISRRMAYHGATMGALSVLGIPANRKGFDPFVPGTRHVPPPCCYRCEFGKQYPGCDLDCLRAIEQVIEFEGPDTVACVIVEPIMGAATGYAVPPPEYLPGLRKICDRYGVLLIFDEVSVGFGRTGKMFAMEHFPGAVPDLVTAGKGLSSGYLPICCVAATPEIADLFIGENAQHDFTHGHTFGTHPACCAAALANLELMEKEALVTRAEEMGGYLRGKLQSLYDHRIVGDLRGKGMCFGIELVKDRGAKEGFDPAQGVTNWIRLRCYELGVILRGEPHILVLCPPLVLKKEQADKIAETLHQAIGEAQRRFAA
jgi:adenosylmethionine-8-amino-7-oxononanoate aminotransferase